MWFEHRTRERIQLVFGAAAIYVALACVAAWLHPMAPSFLASLVRWLLWLPFALVAWGLLEFAGDRFLSLGFWSKMHPVARVALLVAVIAAVVVCAMAGYHLLKEGNAL